jgi:hypothetical protein
VHHASSCIHQLFACYISHLNSSVIRVYHSTVYPVILFCNHFSQTAKSLNLGRVAHTLQNFLPLNPSDSAMTVDHDDHDHMNTWSHLIKAILVSLSVDGREPHLPQREASTPRNNDLTAVANARQSPLAPHSFFSVEIESSTSLHRSTLTQRATQAGFSSSLLP